MHSCFPCCRSMISNIYNPENRVLSLSLCHMSILINSFHHVPFGPLLHPNASSSSSPARTPSWMADQPSSAFSSAMICASFRVWLCCSCVLSCVSLLPPSFDLIISRLVLLCLPFARLARHHNVQLRDDSQQFSTHGFRATISTSVWGLSLAIILSENRRQHLT